MPQNRADNLQENHMSHFVVDRDRCRKDGICARVCPVHIIQAAPGDFPAMNSHQEALCIGCGQCMAFCPTAACVAPGLDPAQCRPLRHDLQPAAEQVEELIFARRSVRVFKETPLPRDVLLRLLDATRFAPTAKNAQPLRWIVLESRPQTKRLAELVVNWMRRLPQEDANMARACHAEGLTRAWDQGHGRHYPRCAPGRCGRGSRRLALGHERRSHCRRLSGTNGSGPRRGLLLGRLCLPGPAHPTGGEVRAFLGVGEQEAACAVQLMGRPLFKPHARPPRKPLDLTWL